MTPWRNRWIDCIYRYHSWWDGSCVESTCCRCESKNKYYRCMSAHWFHCTAQCCEFLLLVGFVTAEGWHFFFFAIANLSVDEQTVAIQVRHSPKAWRTSSFGRTSQTAQTSAILSVIVSIPVQISVVHISDCLNLRRDLKVPNQSFSLSGTG